MATLKRVYLVAIVVFVLGAVVPLALATGTLIEQARYAGHRPDGWCESYPLRPFTEQEKSLFDGSVIVHFINEGPAATGRVCLFDGEGGKRADLTITFAALERRDVVFETPPGVYTYRSEFTKGGGWLTGGGTMNTHWCLSHTEDVYDTFHVSDDGFSGTAESGGCVPGTLAVGLVGLVASGATFALGKFPHVGALLLYSRLAKPRLLDASVRQRVYDLVSREPGIHSRQLIRALDAGEGQTAYHLGVLAREKLLVSIGLPGMRHWFVTGRFTPHQMRAIASLRDPTRRRLYEAVVANPGASLGAVSETIGVSMPQSSRAARALERAGLIERTATGRALALRPLHAPREIYGVANEPAKA